MVRGFEDDLLGYDTLALTFAERRREMDIAEAEQIRRLQERGLPPGTFGDKRKRLEVTEAEQIRRLAELGRPPPLLPPPGQHTRRQIAGDDEKRKRLADASVSQQPPNESPTSAASSSSSPSPTATEPLVTTASASRKRVLENDDEYVRMVALRKAAPAAAIKCQCGQPAEPREQPAWPAEPDLDAEALQEILETSGAEALPEPAPAEHEALPVPMLVEPQELQQLAGEEVADPEIKREINRIPEDVRRQVRRPTATWGTRPDRR